MRFTTVIVVSMVVVMLSLVAFFPTVQRLWFRINSREVTIPWPSTVAGNDSLGTRAFCIVNITGKDSISAILAPSFLTGSQALDQMSPDELVLVVSIGGENRAYPLNMLSRHEIVNDVVGGVPVAVTW